MGWSINSEIKPRGNHVWYYIPIGMEIHNWK